MLLKRPSNNPPSQGSCLVLHTSGSQFAVRFSERRLKAGSLRLLLSLATIQAGGGFRSLRGLAFFLGGFGDRFLVLQGQGSNTFEYNYTYIVSK